MNSLNDLNNYSNTGVYFVDQRPFKIVFTTPQPHDVFANINLGDTLQINPGTGIQTLTNPGAINNSVQYNIDVTAVPGAAITWPTLLYPLSVQRTGNVYTVSNITGVAAWNSVRNPLVNFPRDFIANVDIRSNITWGSNSVSWNEFVTINPIPIFTQPQDFTYDKNQQCYISNTPQVVDTQTDGVYTLTVTPNVTAAISTLTVTPVVASGYFNQTYNSTSHSLTVTGIRSDINYALSHLQMTANSGFLANSSLTYTLTNPVSNYQTQRTQNLINANLYPFVSNITYNRYYTQNTPAPVFANLVPQILGPGADTYRIELQLGSNIGYLANILDNSTWTQSNLTLVLSGGKSQVNSLLPNVYIVPWANTATTTTITLSEYDNNVYQGHATMNLIGSQHDSTGNIVVLAPRKHIFTSNTIWTPTLQEIVYYNCEVLVVAGGGSGGSEQSGVSGGGGGAGGCTHMSNVQLFKPLPYNITVGAGGNITINNSGGNPIIPAAGGNSLITQGNSVIFSAIGGGFGGGHNYFGTTNSIPHAQGTQNGGSGGGAWQMGATQTGSGTTGQGHNGGSAIQASATNPYYHYPNYVPGGGGGAQSAGASTASGTAIPGAGNTYTISGSSVTYSRGGADAYYGGSGNPNPGDGGNGGTYSGNYGNWTVTTTNGSAGIIIISFT